MFLSGLFTGSSSQRLYSCKSFLKFMSFYILTVRSVLFRPDLLHILSRVYRTIPNSIAQFWTDYFLKRWDLLILTLWGRTFLNSTSFFRWITFRALGTNFRFKYSAVRKRLFLLFIIIFVYCRRWSHILWRLHHSDFLNTVWVVLNVVLPFVKERVELDRSLSHIESSDDLSHRQGHENERYILHSFGGSVTNHEIKNTMQCNGEFSFNCDILRRKVEKHFRWPQQL